MDFRKHMIVKKDITLIQILLYGFKNMNEDITNE